MQVPDGTNCRDCPMLCSGGGVDKLTGLIGRETWDARAHRMVGSCRDRGVTVSLILADLDGFKAVNDRWGHQAGDTVLAAVADVLRRVVGAQALLGRYGGHGGDEFLVLLPDTDERTARELAERIRLRLRSVALRLTTTAGDHAQLSGVSASFGVTACRAQDALSLEQLILCADAGLQNAKSCGRDHVCTEPAMRKPPSTGGIVHAAPRPTVDELATEMLDRDACLYHLLNFCHVLQGRWCPDVLLALAAGPRRYNELLAAVRGARVVDGWSGRSRQIQPSILAHTVRRLERDGMLHRIVDGDRDPRAVRYELSRPGHDLLTAIVPAVLWSRDHSEEIGRAQQRSRLPHVKPGFQGRFS